MIHTIVVDDEAPARDELKRFLKFESDFKVVGEAENGTRALLEIERLKPHIVFLDIHMPNKSGLEVAEKLSEISNPPLVVFVTAYDQYAIKAFEVNAIDYVLKPYDQKRFRTTCDRIRDVLKERPAGIKEKLTSLRDYLREGRPLKITGHKRNSKDKVFIHEEDVLFFHVSLTEVTAHLVKGEELLVNATLRSLLAMLDPNHFQQTHRAHIVNLDQVEKISPMFGGNYKISLKNNPTLSLPLSRRYAAKLRQLLKW